MCYMLEDLKVIDAASFLAAPGAATIMADYGADVIKVEAPRGDAYRLLHGRYHHDYNWHLTSRNKRDIGLDISKEEGRAVLHRLIDDADVFALTGARIRPHKAEAGDRAAGAYIVYQDISSSSFEHSEGASGMAQSLIQIDGFSRDPDVVTDLREKVRLALHTQRAASPADVTVGGDTIYVHSLSLSGYRSIGSDPADGSDESIFGFSQDWLITFAETAP